MVQHTQFMAIWQSVVKAKGSAGKQRLARLQSEEFIIENSKRS